MRILSFIFLSILFGQNWTHYLNSPIKLTVVITNGYDNNVLRLSDVEKRDAVLEPSIMGGANTFDSHYSRFSLSGLQKIQFADRNKQVYLYAKGNASNYFQNDNRRYWSGNLKVSYRWGSYRKVEYLLRHLDSYYIRHYIDRDIYSENTASCNFSDREHRLLASHPLQRRLWASGFVSFTQRYFDKPFTEFDLDIITSSLKVSKKFSGLGTIAIEGKYGLADNINFGSTSKASYLDRSYKHFEWYIPFSYSRGLGLLDEVGISLRRDVRQYKAEALNDPLHSGRSHEEVKWDFWGERDITENLTLKGTLRYRKRTTESQFDWVSSLKTFVQVQIWASLEWNMIYDRY